MISLLSSPSKTLTVILTVFCVAMVVYSVVPSNAPSSADTPSSAVRVSGVVAAEVERRVDRQRIVLSDVSYVETPREGNVLLWAPLHPEIHYGDTLVFNCKVERPEPFEGFAYDNYLATKGIYAVCYQPQYMDVHPVTEWSLTGAILEMKSSAIRALRAVLPEPHASFLSGLLFGGSTALSGDLKDDFRETGMSHILAASGYNVSIFSVTLLAVLLSSPLGRRRSLILTTVFLGVYVMIAGAGAAVVRAGIMGFLVVLEKWISRRAFLLNVMLLTASVMLALSPGLLLYDVGFQLSFVATIAIIAFTKPLSERLRFIPEVLGFREAFAGSVSAIVFTLPIVLWHFGAVSLVAPFVNLLVLPLIPYAMATAGVAVVAGLIAGSFGTVIALPAWALSNVLLRIIESFGTIPFALAQIAHAHVVAVATTVLLLGVFLRYRND